MYDGITVDGKKYKNLYVTSIERNFSVLDGDNAGRTTAADMIRDVLGTFYNYTIAIESKYSNAQEYDEFYEVISAPAASHTIVVPYAQTTLTFKAYCTSGKDSVGIEHDGSQKWTGLSINFIAISPQRRA